MVNMTKWIRVLLLAFTLSMPLTLTPAPAQAASVVVVVDQLVAQIATWVTRIKNFVAENAFLGEIVSIIANIYSVLQEYFADMNKRVSEGAKLQVEAIATGSRMDAEMAQAMIDQEAYETLQGRVMDLAAQTAVPKHEYLCKKIELYNLVNTTRDFERAVSRMVLNAIEGMYRGPTDDGSGPMYVFDEEESRCLAKFASPVDGYEAKCIGDATVGPNKRSLIDPDLQFFMMDGSTALEVPPMTSKAIKFSDGSTLVVNVPNPQNENQRAFLAGLYACFQMAGPRPTPGYGEKNMSRPVGKTERTRFDHALAIQSASLKPCADALAHMTRPNSAAASALIAEQKKKCSAASGIISAADLSKYFDNCEKGLTPYQAELLRQSECKSPQAYMANLQSGGTFWEGSDDTIVCMTAWNNWQARLAAMQGALVDAVIGVQKSKGNWQGIGGGKSGALEDHPLMQSEPKRLAKEARPTEPPQARPQPIRAEKKTAKEMEKGVPFSADEVVWPQAVWQ